MSIKVSFNVKYGKNVIDIPINTGQKTYIDNAPTGLSELNGNTYTIINRVPLNNNSSKKWVKHLLTNCGKKDGIYDKSQETMIYKNNTFTVYCNNWQEYLMPAQYYNLSEAEQEEYYTAAPKDLIIFAPIEDTAPISTVEFETLKKKYSSQCAEITGVEIYVQYHNDGSPWRTNHIELIRG